MNHKQKLTMARKMMTPKEIKDGVSPFSCAGWNMRRDSKSRKMLGMIKYAAHRALLRARKQKRLNDFLAGYKSAQKRRGWFWRMKEWIHRALFGARKLPGTV